MLKPISVNISPEPTSTVTRDCNVGNVSMSPTTKDKHDSESTLVTVTIDDGENTTVNLTQHTTEAPASNSPLTTGDNFDEFFKGLDELSLSDISPIKVSPVKPSESPIILDTIDISDIEIDTDFWDQPSDNLEPGVVSQVDIADNILDLANEPVPAMLVSGMDDELPPSPTDLLINDVLESTGLDQVRPIPSYPAMRSVLFPPTPPLTSDYLSALSPGTPAKDKSKSKPKKKKQLPSLKELSTHKETTKKPPVAPIPSQAPNKYVIKGAPTIKKAQDQTSITPTKGYHTIHGPKQFIRTGKKHSYMDRITEQQEVVRGIKNISFDKSNSPLEGPILSIAEAPPPEEMTNEQPKCYDCMWGHLQEYTGHTQESCYNQGRFVFHNCVSAGKVTYVDKETLDNDPKSME